MKMFFAITAAVVISGAALADSNVGQCVSPKSTATPSGLTFKSPVHIYTKPDVNSSSYVLASFAPPTITAEAKGGLVQLESTERRGVTAGWAKLSNFEFQDLRNCN